MRHNRYHTLSDDNCIPGSGNVIGQGRGYTTEARQGDETRLDEKRGEKEEEEVDIYGRGRGEGELSEGIYGKEEEECTVYGR